MQGTDPWDGRQSAETQGNAEIVEETVHNPDPCLIHVRETFP